MARSAPTLSPMSEPRPLHPDPSRPSPRVLALCVFVVACIPFLPALTAGFSDFDDTGFLLEVDQWRGLGPDNLAWIFSTMRLGHYQPLTYLSYAIEFELFGLNPAVFHATNILLHAANAVLLFTITRRVIPIARRDAPGAFVTWASAAAAALWAVHPLRAESVAWITERRDVLSTLFLLLAVRSYIMAARPGAAELASRPRYWLAVLFLVLSLLSKAWGITFVAAALVLDVYPLRRVALGSPAATWRRILLEKLPFLGLGVVFAVVAAAAQRTGSPETMKTLEQWGVLERFAQACYGLVFYLWKTVAPLGLSALYELPDRINWNQWRWLGAIGAALSIAAAAFGMRRRTPAVAASLLLYAIILSPVLGIAQSGIQLVADRYSYIAVMPVFVALAGAAVRARTWLAARGLGAPALGGIAGALGLALFVLTWRQSALWRNTLAMWEAAIAHGHDGPTLRNYYGRQLEKAGRPDEAIREYHVSLAMKPDYADSWFGIGNASKVLGDFKTAESAFIRAAELDRDPTRHYLALGLLYILNLERPADAIGAFLRSVEACEAAGNPARTGTPYLMLGAAYGEVENRGQAVRWLREAAKWPDTRDRAIEHLRDLGESP